MTQAPTISPDRIIKAELRRLSGLYGLQRSEVEARLDHLDTGKYAEIVLAQDGFEVVVGGLGQEMALLDLGRRLDFPAPLLDAFARCSGRLRGKMLYTKIPFGVSAGPSMYFCTIEPWPLIFEALAAVAGVGHVLPELQERVAGNPICFLLGFTCRHDDPAVTVKTYHLLDRRVGNPEAPTLVSYRLGPAGLCAETKEYAMNVSWPRARGRWGRIAAGARAIFGDSHAMMAGYTLPRSARGTKHYIFRYDCRLGAGQHLSRYNYYYDAAMRLLQLGEHRAAVNTLMNAVAYMPGDAAALNAKGFAHLQLGEYREAAKACAAALERDPSLSRQNYEFALRRIVEA